MGRDDGSPASAEAPRREALEETPRREALDETPRRDVLAAAGALFYARGIQNVGMDDIRAASGISLKRLYQLFGSKRGIVARYLDLSDRVFSSGLSRFVDAVDEPRGKLLAVFDWLESWFAQDGFRGCAFVNSFGELGATDRGVAEAARRHKQATRDRLVALAAAAGAGPALGEQLALLAEGATSIAAISGSPRPAEQARRAAEILLAAALDLPPRTSQMAPERGLEGPPDSQMAPECGSEGLSGSRMAPERGSGGLSGGGS